jgi:hypothetical protein
MREFLDCAYPQRANKPVRHEPCGFRELQEYLIDDIAPDRMRVHLADAAL